MSVNAASAIKNKLLQVITGGNGVARGSYISLVPGGLALDSAHMSWATQAAPYAGTPAADNAYAFANVVNTIPTSAGPWVPGTANLARTYRDYWLQNVVVPTVELSGPHKAELESAQAILDSSKYDDYTMYKTEWEMANTNLQLATLSPRDSSYLANMLEARRLANNARTTWQAKGFKSEVERAIATVDHYNGLGLVNAVANLKRDYDQTVEINLTQAGQKFAPVQLYPKNFLAQGGPAWNHYAISESEFSRFQSAGTTKSSGGYDVGFLFWSIAQGGSSSWSSRSQHQVSSAKLKVEFDFMRVNLDRTDWFDTFLLMSPSWRWPDATKTDPDGSYGLLSDGAAPPNTRGPWQMIPTQMIVARNLTVETQGYDLKTTLSSSGWSSSSNSGFLFWSTASGSSSSTSSSYTHSFASNSKLVASQPQIVAFVCQLMPRTPNTDPSLLPSR